MLSTAISRYVADAAERTKMLHKLPEIEKQTRQRMVAEMKTGTPLPKIMREVTESVDGFSAEAKAQFFNIIDKVPMAYQKVNAIFSSPERKSPGSGGIFSIFVSDLCKGCAACVTACGDHHGAQDGAGDRRGQRRARDRHGLPRPAARYFAEVPRPVQRRESGRLKDRDPAQHAHGAAQTMTRW